MKGTKFRTWAFGKMQCPKKNWDGEFFIRMNGVLYMCFDVKEDTHILMDGRKRIGGIEEYPLNKKSIVLMQFTGLLDKNGEEIYEGDIVKWTSEDYIKAINYKKTSPVFWCESLTGWVAYWGEAKWGENLNEYSQYHFAQICPNGVEIIGNIYENPELLK